MAHYQDQMDSGMLNFTFGVWTALRNWWSFARGSNYGRWAATEMRATRELQLSMYTAISPVEHRVCWISVQYVYVTVVKCVSASSCRLSSCVVAIHSDPCIICYCVFWHWLHVSHSGSHHNVLQSTSYAHKLVPPELQTPQYIRQK